MRTMADGKARGDVNPFLPTRRVSRIVRSPSDPDPAPKHKPLASRSARSFTPRGQRFSKLSDAYINITSRVGPSKTVGKLSDESQSSSTGPALLPVASPQLAESQDELQTSSSASDMRTLVEKTSHESLDSTDSLGASTPRMGGSGNDGSSLGKQIDNELSKLKAQPHDTSSSTIERIVAQYDGCTSSLKAEYNNTREYRVKTELSISQPPQRSLPEVPPTNMQPISNMQQNKHDSPVPASSVTDSQHLLDVEAQAQELQEAQRALIPRPLNISQHHPELEIPQRQHNAIDNNDALMGYEAESHIATHFAQPGNGNYQTYLHPPMERDISQELMRYSSYAFYDSNLDNYSPVQQAQPKGNIFCESSLPTAGIGEKTVRHIKVIIGRESHNSNTSHNHYAAQVDAENGFCDTYSEDGDWATEATSDAGFGFGSGAISGRPLTSGFKKAGSSLADYSDDGHEEMLDRFGSREKIIQQPAGNEQCKLYDIRRSRELKLAVLLPLRPNASPESPALCWTSATPEGPGHFRPQTLHKNAHPYTELGSGRAETSGRLVFNFDHNHPPRYRFSDSASERGHAAASTKANCGTYRCSQRESLPSPVPELGVENHLSTTESQFDGSFDTNADQNPSNCFSQQNKPHQGTIHGQDTKLSIYAADRQQQLEEIDNREFAAASSYYDPPSATSVRSKFNFELLPLDLARQRNKLQRDSGETNETESAAARIKRKQSLHSIETEPNPPEPPARAFLTGHNLSVDFSVPNWQTHGLGFEDTLTTFSMGHFDRTASSDGHIYRRVSSPGVVDNSSSFSTPSTTRRLWVRPTDRHVSTRNRYWLRRRPGFVATDDYVSNRANNIRRACFSVIVVLSIVPVVGALALTGTFNSGLKWATRGEVDRLTSRQRRFIKVVLLVEFVLYLGGTTTIIVYFVVKSRARH